MFSNSRLASGPPTFVRVSALIAIVLLAGGLVDDGQAAEPTAGRAGTTAPHDDPDLDWKDDLADIDLEGLMQIPVTSVAGVERPLHDTPAAIYVITNEDIRRGGTESSTELPTHFMS